MRQAFRSKKIRAFSKIGHKLAREETMKSFILILASIVIGVVILNVYIDSLSKQNVSLPSGEGFKPEGFKGPTEPPHVKGPSGPPPNY